jgi:uncharacterized RDD family membrane protein YckC
MNQHQPRGGLGRITDAVTSRVVGAIDPDTVLDHVDVNALLDRVDVNALLDRIDVERLLDRVDVDRLLARADVEGLVRRSGVPDMVAASTGRVAGSALDSARRQLVVLDVLIARVVDRLLRRTRRGWADAPAGLRPARPRLSASGRLDVSGRYAGPVTRFAALVADAWILTAGSTLLLAGIDYLGRTLFDSGLEVDSAAVGWAIAFAVVAFLYVFLGTEIAGRTPGKALVGLRVVRWDGDPVRAGAAFVRTVAAVPGTLLAGISPLLGVLQRDRRALHDVVAGTAVVHDWSPRAVELPPGLSRSLARASLP